MKKILILLSVLNYQISFTQEILVEGNVTDNYELPFPGSQVINSRTNQKVITDFDGNYSIIAKLGDTLKFKAFEKVENCYTTSKRIVFDNVEINVKLWFLETIRYKFCQTKPRKLLVFVGKLIDVKNLPDSSICIEVKNTHGIGKYEIIDELYGSFLGEKIVFFLIFQNIAINIV